MPTGQLSRNCKIETTMNPSAGDTVIPTKTSSKTTGDFLTLERGGCQNLDRHKSKTVTRKRRQMEPPPSKMEIPRKSPRHEDLSGILLDTASTSAKSHADGIQGTLKRSLSDSDNLFKNDHITLDNQFFDNNQLVENNQIVQNSQIVEIGITKTDQVLVENNQIVKSSQIDKDSRNINPSEPSAQLVNKDVGNSCQKMAIFNYCEISSVDPKLKRKLSSDENEGSDVTNEIQESLNGDEILGEQTLSMTNQKLEVAMNLSKDKEVSGLLKKPPDASKQCRRRTEKANDVERLRKTIQWLEEGARRMREDLEAVRSELYQERKAAKLARRDLDKAKRDAKISEAAKNQQIISDLKSRLSQSPSRLVTETTLVSSKVEFLKDENHRRELSALKKRLSEAETTIKKLKTDSLASGGSTKRRKVDTSSFIDAQKLEIEVQSLRAANKKLEEKLQIATEAEKLRGGELRIQHENHEAEQASLQKIFRTEKIKLMDEIRSKSREIEKLNKLLRKLRSSEDENMRKLRESERNHQIRLAPRIEEKIPNGDHAVDLCKRECEAVAEVERLRELATEQQEAIEILRQAVKEKERKLDQLTNKKRKEEFYKQWLELEPVAEVDDEEENEGDSALSSAPSSLSPQPGGCAQWQANGVTREAYESLLFEVEELQTKLLEEQRELTHAKSQVRDLEKALLQETRGSQNSRRALSDKLRDAEERESNLITELSELREQNELLEFRVLELEESPNQRETPDPADSGIVSPEPIHLYKDQSNKHKDRAVATVIPYSSMLTQPVSPVPQKPPLSLQESGIFEEEDAEVELTSCGTQTEAPAGELLQEVQRLQELRVRIQERAVKVPVSPVTDTKTCSSPEVTEAVDIAQLAAYQEKIHDLEERLSTYEEAEESFIQERQLSKQRDEELLDENYKLTEKIYWLENEIRNLRDVPKTICAETMTELKLGVDFSSQCEDNFEFSEENFNEESFSEDNPTDLSFRSSKSYESCKSVESYKSTASSVSSKSDESFKSTESSVESSKSVEVSKSFNQEVPASSKECCLECCSLLENFESRIEQLGQTEYILRQQITVLERRERAFIETLKQADTTWSSIETDYKRKYEDMQERLKAQTKLNRVFLEHLATLNKISPGACSFENGYIEELVERLGGALDSMDVADGIEKMEENVSEDKDDKTEVTKTDDMFPVDRGIRCQTLGPSASPERVGSSSSRTPPSKTVVRDNLSPRPWPGASTRVQEDNVAKLVPGKIVESKGAVSQVSLASDEHHEEESEAQITVDETEPDKKDKLAGAAWSVQVMTRNGTSCRKIQKHITNFQSQQFWQRIQIEMCQINTINCRFQVPYLFLVIISLWMFYKIQ